MRIITGTIINGVTLASGDSPVLIGGVVTNDGTGLTVGVYGSSGIYGDIRNFGTVGDIGGTSTGIELVADGTVTNGSPLATDALIGGAGYALVLDGDGTVSNFGTIAGGFAGARILKGGRLTNGSTGLISGGRELGVGFSDNATVVNYGSISAGVFAGIFLFGGGLVANGASTAANSTISGGSDGIVFGGGLAKVSNFGTMGWRSTYDSARPRSGSPTATRRRMRLDLGCDRHREQRWQRDDR